MRISIDDLKLLDTLILRLDEMKPSAPDRVWIRLFKASLEQHFVPAFHAADGGAS